MTLRDHSARAYRTYSVIEKTGREGKLRDALVKAGFPTEAIGWVQSESIRLAQWYRGQVDTREARPRPREIRESLLAVLKRGEAFGKALSFLSPDTRLAIMDADELRHKDQPPADSSRLSEDLTHFLSCTKMAVRLTPKDAGGKSAEASHVNFAFNLAVIWRMNFAQSGITKHGISGTFHGPLLDFAETVLKLEGAAYRNDQAAFLSRQALGKSLHKYRGRAAEVAKERLAVMRANSEHKEGR